MTAETPSDPNVVVRIQAKVELADYRRLVFRQTYTSPVYIFINLVCIGIVLYNSFREVNNLTTVFVITFMLYMPVSLYFKARSNYKANKALHELIAYEFTPEMVTVRSASFNGAFPWKSVYKVTEIRDWFLLFTNKQTAMLIPKKAFVSDTEVETFRRFSRQGMGGTSSVEI